MQKPPATVEPHRTAMQGKIRQLKDRSCAVSSDRLREILDLEAEKQENEQRKMAPESLAGDIKFEHVNLRYGTRQRVLLFAMVTAAGPLFLSYPKIQKKESFFDCKLL